MNAMLTDEDRMLGHALAAEWLEARGERDDLLIADHYERGGAYQRAIPHLRCASTTDSTAPRPVDL